MTRKIKNALRDELTTDERCGAGQAHRKIQDRTHENLLPYLWIVHLAFAAGIDFERRDPRRNSDARLDAMIDLVRRNP